jgi:hypothetical protein
MRAQEASRRALAAVARLTIIAGAAGCAGNVVVEQDGAPADLDPGEAEPAKPPDVTLDPSEEACFAGDTDSAKCCSDLLLVSFYEGDLFTDPTLATDEEKACCDLAVATMDAWASAEQPPFDYSLPSNCCSTGLVEGGWDAHPSCTPWGPPMPPAMPPGFALTFELEGPQVLA